MQCCAQFWILRSGCGRRPLGPQEVRQGAKCGHISMRSRTRLPGHLCCRLEHPARNLLPPVAGRSRQAASVKHRAASRHGLMDDNRTIGPRMPRVKQLANLRPVGVPSSCCITGVVRIHGWEEKRPTRPTSTSRFSQRRKTGRRSTYQAAEAVQTNRATSKLSGKGDTTTPEPFDPLPTASSLSPAPC